MYVVYVLKSKSSGRYYIGSTNNIERRLIEHNSNKNLSTRGRGPWVIILTENFLDRSSAMKREYQIKRYKGGEAFHRLVG